MFVIYYAPRHYDIQIKLLKASTMSFIAISLTCTFLYPFFCNSERIPSHLFAPFQNALNLQILSHYLMRCFYQLQWLTIAIESHYFIYS